MPAPVIPTKTPLGQEELRHRTGGLGQRHRTILFLIDGRRPLSEVLSLAQAAGAQTVHFEDLVRLGYVEMPPEEAVAPAPAAVAPAEAVELTHVELTVPAEPAAPDALTMPAPVAETVILPPAVAEPAVQPGEAARPPAPVPVAPAEPPPTRSPVAQAVAQLVAPEPEEPLAAVRRCLLETLRLDLTPYSFRAQSRVREAADTQTLIDIVWEIESDLPRGRRSRAGVLSLERARELLGLGNTLVDEDSQSGRLDDDAW